MGIESHLSTGSRTKAIFLGLAYAFNSHHTCFSLRWTTCVRSLGEISNGSQARAGWCIRRRACYPRRVVVAYGCRVARWKAGICISRPLKYELLIGRGSDGTYSSRTARWRCERCRQNTEERHDADCSITTLRFSGYNLV